MEFKNQLMDILKNTGSEPILMVYNLDKEVKIEVADTSDGKNQEELAGKVFELVRQYYSKEV